MLEHLSTTYLFIRKKLEKYWDGKPGYKVGYGQEEVLELRQCSICNFKSLAIHGKSFFVFDLFGLRSLTYSNNGEWHAWTIIGYLW